MHKYIIYPDRDVVLHSQRFAWHFVCIEADTLRSNSIYPLLLMWSAGKSLFIALLQTVPEPEGSLAQKRGQSNKARRDQKSDRHVWSSDGKSMLKRFVKRISGTYSQASPYLAFATFRCACACACWLPAMLSCRVSLLCLGPIGIWITQTIAASLENFRFRIWWWHATLVRQCIGN